ncbi:hypothetical protein GCK32_010704 [Trichostrongylus colubriformis]|uniref:Uncharacterized protein n=1 Tax=Trichostrongylus colubriformis TaxID=6319 RepID=A0AAN8IPY5_TRICO
MTTVLFMRLLWKNQRRYNRLVVEPTKNNNSTIQYTLSIRFQLNENIRSMKLLRNLLFFGTFTNFIGFVLLAGAHIDWMHCYSDVVAHYLDAILNLYVASYATLFPVIGYYSDDTYKNLVRTMPFFGRFFRDSTISPECNAVEEGSIYFANLNRQWNILDSNKRTKRI